VTQETRSQADSAQNYELLQQAEMEAQQELEQYKVVDEEEGIYQIPIGRAMDVIAGEEYQRTEGAAGAQAEEGGQ
jgi:hypothetical protein